MAMLAAHSAPCSAAGAAAQRAEHRGLINHVHCHQRHPCSNRQPSRTAATSLCLPHPRQRQCICLASKRPPPPPSQPAGEPPPDDGDEFDEGELFDETGELSEHHQALLNQAMAEVGDMNSLLDGETLAGDEEGEEPLGFDPEDPVATMRATSKMLQDYSSTALSDQALRDAIANAGLSRDLHDGEEEGELDLAGEGEQEQEPVDPDSPDAKYVLRPRRRYPLSSLLSKAALYQAGDEMAEAFPWALVSGLHSQAELVRPGDIFCCLLPKDVNAELVAVVVEEAVRHQPGALLLDMAWEQYEELEGVVPEGLPVLWVAAPAEIAQRLAVAFYDAPGRELLNVGIAGQQGKTTTAWLIRGILEEMQQVTGMVGSVEWALAEDRLEPDGRLWQAGEEDPSAGRESSSPFMVTPYAGKYLVPELIDTSPMHLQQTLAGMKERGATCCVLELPPIPEALDHLMFVEMGVVVHTTLTPPEHTVQQAARQAARQATQQAVQAQAEQEEGSEDTQQPYDASIPIDLGMAVLQEGPLRAAVMPFTTLSDSNTQAAVINLDDPAAGLVQAAAHAVPHITYAIDNTSAMVRTESIKSDIWESEVIVRTPLGRLQIITQLLGRHNVYNILAAVATGLALKVPLKSIVAGIEAVEVVPGRCEVLDEGQDFSVIVDCADTPQALEAMLLAVKPEAKRVITVVGCKGDEDREVRPRMAEVAHSHSDLLIFTNDSPRTEPPEQILQDMVSGLPEELMNKYSGYVYFPFQDQGHVPLWFEPYLQKAQRSAKRHIVEDRFSAIRAAIGTAQAGDVVLIAGRGNVDFMEYDDGKGGVERGWFDDRVEARAALSKLAYLNQLTKLSRKELPWGKALSEMDSLVEVDVEPADSFT